MIRILSAAVLSASILFTSVAPAIATQDNPTSVLEAKKKKKKKGKKVQAETQVIVKVSK